MEMNWVDRVLDLFNGNAILLKLLGYSSMNKKRGSEERYVEAKKPVMKDFTSPNLDGQALPDLHKWPLSQGWVGLQIPNDYVAVEIHSIEDGELLTQMLDDSEYCYHALRTSEGFQFIFKDPGEVLKKITNVRTVSGYLVDYRIQMEDYIVLPTPESDSLWVRIADEELDVMPHWFNPLYQVSKE
jgi:putative DNA primase/helicase